MNPESTLAEVRRISAGGIPKPFTRTKRFMICSAERIGWWANDYVVKLLEGGK